MWNHYFWSSPSGDSNKKSGGEDAGQNFQIYPLKDTWGVNVAELQTVLFS